MIIQHNMMALNSYNRLSGNNTLVGKNLEKLSSGFKINRAGDDAAGLAISEKMRAQITGLARATQNSQDGISLVQTAEGQLTEVHSMLNRMVDLATQSSNGTIDNDVDRKNLQKEVQSLKDEIDRIASTSHFNGIKLLDGSMGSGKSSFTAGIGAGVHASNAAVNFTGLDSNVKSVVIDIVDGTTEGEAAEYNEKTGEIKLTVTRDIANAAGKLTGQELKDALDTLDMDIGVSALGDLISATNLDTGGAKTLTFNSATFTEVKAANAKYNATVDGKDFSVLANTAGVSGNVTFTATGSAAGKEGVVVDSSNGNPAIDLLNAKEYSADEITKMLNKAGADITVQYNGTISGANLVAALNTNALAGGAGLAGGGLSLQIGDTAEQRVEVKVGSMSVTSLGLDAVDVSLENLATDSIDVIKKAINTVSGTRADLGAIQNRLEHTINNLTTTTENMTAAEARIRDTDMAKEMMAFTKNNVLAQAAQAMLAQANQQPQQVLQLLR